MRKYIILIFTICCSYITILAQYDIPKTSIVVKFGERLTSWANDKSESSIIDVEDYFDDIISLKKKPIFRIDDQLTDTLAKHYNYSNFLGHDFNKFIVLLMAAKDSYNNIEIKISNIKEVDINKIKGARTGYSYVKCDIEVTSLSFHYKCRDLIEITNNKIAKIGDYEKALNDHSESFWERTWNEVRDSQGVGLVYEYGKNYPVNVSLSFYKSLFMLGLDMGFADTTNHISTQKVDFTDILNYKITKGEYKPKYYFTLTPAIYMKYVSVGWGVGVLTLEGETITEGKATEVNGDIINTKSLDNTVYTNAKYRFFMRPNVKLYIPCSKSISIITSASYNWAWGSKDLSGFTYGIGLRYNID